MTPHEMTWKIAHGKKHPQLSGDLETDVVIVGAGITGIVTAYVLTKVGLNVVVLEKNDDLAQNATLHTTAFITKMIDTPFDALASLFGKDTAELIWQSGQDAIDLIAEAVQQEHIDCEFVSVPVVTIAKNKHQLKKLTEEFTALKKSGIDASIHQYRKEFGFEHLGSLEIPGQAKFHPMKFVYALAEAASKAGAKFFTQSEVVTIENLQVKTKHGQVTAKDIVLATHAPMTNEGTHFRKAKYLSYVYELEIPKNTIPVGLYLDMGNPYHYFRVDSEAHADRMIVGGEDHRKDVPVNPKKNFAALARYAKTILGAHEYKTIREWSGIIIESIDGLPLIGAIKPHEFVATAFSGNGMTYSAVSAMIIRDTILKHKNLYIDVYDVKRIPTLRQLTRKGLDYAGEFLGGAVKNTLSAKK